MYIFKIFAIFLMLHGMVACSQVTPAPFRTQTSTVEARPVATLTPQAQPTIIQTQPAITETPTVVSTIALPTSTELPTATSPAALAEARLNIKCLDISSSIQDNADLSGEVFLTGQFVVGKGYSGLDSKLVLQTGTLASIKAPENTRQGGYLVSPNQKQLSYWKSNLGADGKPVDLSLVIENADGKVLAKVPGQLGTWDSFYWLDNNRIVIGSYGQPTVLDPFTGEVYGLEKWYAQSPGGMHIVPMWGVNGVFDTQLSRLFYVQEDGTLLLWDLKGKKILAQLKPYSKYWPEDQPQWSWDDQEVVVGYASVGAANMGEELVSVSRDGIISQLTSLGKYYSQAAISKFSWSQDGRKIAFFFTDYSKEGNLSQFAVLNRETLQVTNYCNLGGSINPNERPVWSPDGTKVLIGRMEADSTTFKTILLDLSGDYAAVLAEDLIPVGWMMAP